MAGSLAGPSRSRTLRLPHLLLTLLLLLVPASAKTTSGEFRLSGLSTEYVLGSFAVHAGQKGTMQVRALVLEREREKMMGRPSY